MLRGKNREARSFTPRVVVVRRPSPLDVVSASAVARSWGDKVVEYARTFDEDDGNDANNTPYRFLVRALDPGYGINLGAFFVSTVAVLLLLDGVKESKRVTNFFSVLKVLLIVFISVTSILLAKGENLRPFIPPEFGVSSSFGRGGFAHGGSCISLRYTITDVVSSI